MLRITVLSPHLDDAAFSLYLSLREWQRPDISLAVLNFFTVSAYAPRASSTGAEAVSLIRKTEDRRVLSRIGRGIRVRACDLLDAPLRLGLKSEAVCRPDTQVLASRSEPELAALIRKHAGSDLVIAPLGLGGHVDHLAVHHAAIASVSPPHLAFYEDLPYAIWTLEAVLSQRIREAEAGTQVRLRPAIVRREHGVWRKQHVIAQYRSQISPEQAASIARFAARYESGERLWIPRYGKAWMLLTKNHACQSASINGHSRSSQARTGLKPLARA